MTAIGTAVETALTPADCAAGAHRLAETMRDSGFAPGDRVLLLGDNEPGYLIAVMALISLDASLVLVDRGQTPAEIDEVAVRASARWALLGGDLDEVRLVLAARLGEDAVLRYAELSLAGEEHRALALPGAWRLRRDAAVLWSSGTTGRPKGVVRSGESLIWNTVATMRAMRYRREDVLFPLLPFSHQYGLSLVLLWWTTGCSLLVAPYRRLTDALRAIERYGVTTVDAAPPTYHALLELLERRPVLRAGLETVRMWCVGGAPLPTPLRDRFTATLGLPLLDGYGLSELGNVSLATPDNPVGCGQPIPGVGVRVEQGQVLVSSESLMEGYLDEHGRLSPVVGGWFPTGDLGYLDGAGNVHVLGRRQAVHRMGYTLYPESIQRQAETCGAPVCVVGVDDERRGSQLVAFVEDPALRDARYWRERIDPLLAVYERPNLVEVLPRLPVGASGKIDRALLTRLAHGRRTAATARQEDHQ